MIREGDKLPTFLVPRGTRIVPMRFCGPLRMALELGIKTHTRRIIGPGNSEVIHGDFSHFDFDSAFPDGLSPVSGLRGRIVVPGRRTVRRGSVRPRLAVNAAIWPRVGQSGEDSKRVNARTLLKVIGIRAERLHDVTQEDALAEGIAIFDPQFLPEGFKPVNAYRFLLSRMGRLRAKQWRETEMHRSWINPLELAASAPTPRHVFALMWENLGGRGSWASNPWVWRYELTNLAPIVHPIPSLSVERYLL